MTTVDNNKKQPTKKQPVKKKKNTQQPVTKKKGGTATPPKKKGGNQPANKDKKATPASTAATPPRRSTPPEQTQPLARTPYTRDILPSLLPKRRNGSEITPTSNQDTSQLSQSDQSTSQSPSDAQGIQSQRVSGSDFIAQHTRQYDQGREDAFQRERDYVDGAGGYDGALARTRLDAREAYKKKYGSYPPTRRPSGGQGSQHRRRRYREQMGNYNNLYNNMVEERMGHYQDAVQQSQARVKQESLNMALDNIRDNPELMQLYRDNQGFPTTKPQKPTKPRRSRSYTNKRYQDAMQRYERRMKLYNQYQQANQVVGRNTDQYRDEAFQQLLDKEKGVDLKTKLKGVEYGDNVQFEPGFDPAAHGMVGRLSSNASYDQINGSTAQEWRNNLARRTSQLNNHFPNPNYTPGGNEPQFISSDDYTKSKQTQFRGQVDENMQHQQDWVKAMGGYDKAIETVERLSREKFKQKYGHYPTTTRARGGGHLGRNHNQRYARDNPRYQSIYNQTLETSMGDYHRAVQAGHDRVREVAKERTIEGFENNPELKALYEKHGNVPTKPPVKPRKPGGRYVSQKKKDAYKKGMQRYNEQTKLYNAYQQSVKETRAENYTTFRDEAFETRRQEHYAQADHHAENMTNFEVDQDWDNLDAAVVQEQAAQDWNGMSVDGRDDLRQKMLQERMAIASIQRQGFTEMGHMIKDFREGAGLSRTGAEQDFLDDQLSAFSTMDNLQDQVRDGGNIADLEASFNRSFTSIESGDDKVMQDFQNSFENYRDEQITDKQLKEARWKGFKDAFYENWTTPGGVARNLAFIGGGIALAATAPAWVPLALGGAGVGYLGYQGYKASSQVSQGVQNNNWQQAVRGAHAQGGLQFAGVQAVGEIGLGYGLLKSGAFKMLKPRATAASAAPDAPASATAPKGADVPMSRPNASASVDTPTSRSPSSVDDLGGVRPQGDDLNLFRETPSEGATPNRPLIDEAGGRVVPDNDVNRLLFGDRQPNGAGPDGPSSPRPTHPNERINPDAVRQQPPENPGARGDVDGPDSPSRNQFDGEEPGNSWEDGDGGAWADEDGGLADEAWRGSDDDVLRQPMNESRIQEGLTDMQPGDKTVIGRHGDIQLDDPARHMSGRHLTVEALDDGAYNVIDGADGRPSTNGTYYKDADGNWQKMGRDPRRMEPGDELRFGENGEIISLPERTGPQRPSYTRNRFAEQEPPPSNPSDDLALRDPTNDIRFNEGMMNLKSGDEITVGRNGDIQLDDPTNTMSNKHATIEASEDGTYFIQDAVDGKPSKNGTYYMDADGNWRKINYVARLEPETQIRFGPEGSPSFELPVREGFSPPNRGYTPRNRISGLDEPSRPTSENGPMDVADADMDMLGPYRNMADDVDPSPGSGNNNPPEADIDDAGFDFLAAQRGQSDQVGPSGNTGGNSPSGNYSQAYMKDLEQAYLKQGLSDNFLDDAVKAGRIPKDFADKLKAQRAAASQKPTDQPAARQDGEASSSSKLRGPEYEGRLERAYMKEGSSIDDAFLQKKVDDGWVTQEFADQLRAKKQAASGGASQQDAAAQNNEPNRPPASPESMASYEDAVARNYMREGSVVDDAFLDKAVKQGKISQDFADNLRAQKRAAAENNDANQPAGRPSRPDSEPPEQMSAGDEPEMAGGGSGSDARQRALAAIGETGETEASRKALMEALKNMSSREAREFLQQYNRAVKLAENSAQGGSNQADASQSNSQRPAASGDESLSTQQRPEQPSGSHSEPLEGHLEIPDHVQLRRLDAEISKLQQEISEGNPFANIHKHKKLTELQQQRDVLAKKMNPEE